MNAWLRKRESDFMEEVIFILRLEWYIGLQQIWVERENNPIKNKQCEPLNKEKAESFKQTSSSPYWTDSKASEEKSGDLSRKHGGN